MWVHSKNTELTPEETTIIEDAIVSNNLNSTLLYNTVQDPEICGRTK